jgi:hypothetical protein
MLPMKELPTEWVTSFERRLDQAKIPHPLRKAYHRWVKFYLYFCQKFAYPATAPTALGPFLTKLADKSHSIADRHHAAVAFSNPWLLLISLGPWLLGLVLYSYLSSIASRIYLCALYLYAADKTVPGPYEASMMSMAFKPKKAGI